MSLEGKIKVALNILRRLRKLAGVSRYTNMHSALALSIGLEKLGVIDFLEEPRSLEEVANFLGDVRRLDFLKELMEVLTYEKVTQKVDGRYKVNLKRLEELKLMRRTNQYFKDFEPLTSGFERVLHEVMLDVLRGVEFDFVSPEVATVFYFQNASPIYAFGRELLLELGGGRSRFRGCRILDLGCGFGAEPLTILRYLDFDCHLICADFFPNVVDECMHTMVEVDGKSVPLKDLENVDFVVLDPSMRKPLPIPDEHVDAVFSFALLHWSKHPDKIIKECARVIKRGGELLLVTPLKKRNQVTAADIMLKVIGGNKYYTKEEIEKLLLDAGLTNYTIFISHMIAAKKVENLQK